MPLLDIRNLTVTFATRRGAFTAVDGVDVTLDRNEVLAIVGKSGSGKSVAMLAVMGLLPPTATVTADRMAFDGADLLSDVGQGAPPARRQGHGDDLSGADVLVEPLLHRRFPDRRGAECPSRPRPQARGKRIVELLAEVGIPDPPRRAHAYPHQLSGGMSQSVMIAMALACRPKLLIADEPTTALDVTIQAQILDLLLSLRRENGMGLVLITHDMGVVAETADRVIVQYAGQQVEANATEGCLPIRIIPIPPRCSQPCRNGRPGRLPAISGVVPGQFDRPCGCLFSPRCAFAFDLCRRVAPRPAPPQFGAALCHTPLARGVPQREALARS